MIRTVLMASIFALVGAGTALSQTTRPAATQPAHDETRWLQNVRQLTSKEIGLDRAGEAYFSPDGKRLCFQAYPAGKTDYQIYVLNVDGSGLKMVSTGTGACTCSFFHPGGEKTLFSSNHEDLREPNEAQMEPRRHTTGYTLPPLVDGVVALGCADDLTFPGGAWAHGCADDLTLPQPLPEREGGLGEARARVCADDLTLPQPLPAREGGKTPPPATKPGEPAKHGGGRGYVWKYYPGMEIYEYTFATGALRNLTKSDGYDAEASYSPDGKLIVFSSLRDGQQKVYICDADGANVRRISNGPGDGGPFFSPDGKRVIYRGDRAGSGNMQVYTNNLEGTDEKQLTKEDGASHWCPYFHPSGKWIAYTLIQSRGGPPRFDVYVMRADGSDVRRVTSQGEWNGLPVFSPDGKRLAWTSKREKADTPQIFVADFVGISREGELRAER